MEGLLGPMKRVIAILGLTIGLIPTSAASGRGGEAWTYSGPYGPQNWGLISEDFARCETGEQQSPIDLRDPVETNLADFEVDWNPADWMVYNTGRGLRVQSDDGGRLNFGGTTYRLLQFHFHTPAEHTINGKAAPMEGHFVHVSDDNKIAIVAVMMTGGGRYPPFERVMARVPEQSNDPLALTDFDPTRLLPEASPRMHYEGSLTTPPCSETVSWIVLTEPLTVSDAAITTFGILFGNNARPVQPLNRRFILSSGP